MAAAGLSDEQLGLAAKLTRIGQRHDATPMEIKSAIETGLVETNLSNPSGGDADSAGWRQERASLYKNPTNIRDAARRYYAEARAVRGQYQTAGELAAAVQRPAAQYRGRYQDVSGKADQVLQAVRGGAGGGTTSAAPAAAAPVQQGTSVPSAAALQQALASVTQQPEMMRAVSAPPVPVSLQPQAASLGSAIGGDIPTVGASAAPAARSASSGVDAALASAKLQQAQASATGQVDTSGTEAATADVGQGTAKATGAGGALAYAQSKLGKAEVNGSNTGPYVDKLEAKFGLHAQPWCAMFTSTAVVHGGAPDEAQSASVAEIRSKAHAKKGYRGFVKSDRGKGGDLILFGDDHIGMLQGRAKNGYYTMIAGNDSNKVQKRKVAVGSGDIVRPAYKDR